MNRKNGSIAAVAMMIAACGPSVRSTPVAYAPQGQAAQPGSWSQPAQEVASVSGSPQGQAAQPGSWTPGDEPEAPAVYMTGIPAGQAAQPGAWRKSAF